MTAEFNKAYRRPKRLFPLFVLLAAGLFGFAMTALFQHASAIGIQISASATAVCRDELSHTLTVDWNVTDASEGVQVTISVTLPDGSTQTTTQSTPQGSITFDLPSPGGGNVQARVAAQMGGSTASALASASLAPCGDSQELPELTLGGNLGHVSDTTAKIWIRGDSEAEFKAQFRPQVIGFSSLDTAWQNSDSTQLSEDQDFIGMVELTGLSVQTSYEYRAVLDDVPLPNSQATFTTMIEVDSPGVIRFAIGADLSRGLRPFTIFDKISEKKPHFTILMGDQVYADDCYTEGYFDFQYSENWSDLPFQRFMDNHLVYMMWDDHEILNDYFKGRTRNTIEHPFKWTPDGIGPNLCPSPPEIEVDKYPIARAAYEKFQAPNNPSPIREGELYYSFKVGKIDFFVLDTRSHRDRNSKTDGPNKTMLGQDQLEDLKQWLSTATGKFKFIVSSVSWHDYGTTINDSWKGFKGEREKIFDYVTSNDIRGVALLSGDQHWTGIFDIPRSGLGGTYHFLEFSPTPLGIGNRSSESVPKPQDDPRVLFKFSEVNEDPRDENKDPKVFGFFVVDTRPSPAKFKFEVFACSQDKSNGNQCITYGSLWSKEFTELDIFTVNFKGDGRNQ